jgi:hypothetical protein
MDKLTALRWTRCPPGELDRLESYLRLQRFWSAVGTVVLAVATMTAVGAAGWVVADAFALGSPDPSPAPATCHPPPRPCHE